MKKINIQFHATYIDLFDFVMEMKKNKFIVVGLILFPQFEIIKINEKLDAFDIKKFNMIVISKLDIQKEDNYSTFLKKQDNNLLITIGKELDDELYESSMGIWSELEIDPDFKKIITSFKKKMNRGAWVLNPYNNAREYYKNHMYTNNARLAYERGVKIHPVVGWNLYELKNE